MTDRQELANRLSSCADGRQSIAEFEDWFDSNSWDVHLLGDDDLTDAVFRIESLYSAYTDQRLSRDSLLQEFRELASTILPLIVSKP